MTTFNERTTRKTQPVNFKKKWTQAFKLTPWRRQIQNVGLFLLALVIVLLVASVYLSISGRAAAAGLSTYSMSVQRQRLEREIADRKALIAELTSGKTMETRAKELGFKRINPADAVYIEIPGYTGKQTAILASPPGIDDSEKSIVLPSYRESLWDWMFQGIYRLSASVAGDVQ